MEFAYAFTARTGRNRPMAGIVYAPDADLAFAKLRRNGLTPTEVQFRAGASLRNFIQPGFDAKDLVRLYRTLGRRMNNGRSILDGLESSTEFVRNERLRQAALMMRQGILDGKPEHEAMLAAGFDQRDAMVIRAAIQSGKVGDSFLQVAHDLEQKNNMRETVRAIFRMPSMMLLAMWAFFYLVLYWITPKTMTMLKNINAKAPPFNQAVFDFSNLFNTNLFLFSLLWIAVPIGVAMAIRSRYFERLADQWQLMRMIAIKADMSTAWLGFALLFDASVPPAECARIIREACLRTDSQAAFGLLERYIHAGMYLEDAVSRAEFPHFIIDGVKAAATGGQTVQGLRDMTADLAEDLAMLTTQLKDTLQIASLGLMGGAVFLFFFITYYPMLSITLSNV